MSYFELRPPIPDDFLLIKPREPFAPVIDPAIAPSLNQTTFTTRTIVRAGRPIAILGLWEWTPGVALGWGLVDRAARPRDIIRLTETIRTFIVERRLRRVEATARVDFPAGARWLRAIGFLPEGLMECYGPSGEAHLRFAMTFPQNTQEAT